MKSDAQLDDEIMRVFETVLKHSGDRHAYLREIAQDGTLVMAVDEQLNWHERMGNFLLQPLNVYKQWERPFQAGQTVSNRFEIIREVGEGGMGIVYEAFDRKRKQRIAIKSAKPGFHTFLSPELESAIKVRHPNICLVNEIHTAETVHGEIDFLTMEFLDGETLSDRMARQGRLIEEDAMEITRQLCAALAEAHRSGVIHRDLKGNNIILTRTADQRLRAVITDFGLARESSLPSSQLAGTVPYMAPELLKGASATRASDIYALGVVLYEMVTGHPPYQSDSILARRTAPPRRPSLLVKGLNTRWDRTVLKCLKPTPADRPPDAVNIISLLEKRRDRTSAGSVRLVILPFDESFEAGALWGGVLQDVTDRIRQYRKDTRAVVVIPPDELLATGVRNAEEAARTFRATHVLEVRFLQEQPGWIVEAWVRDLTTRTCLREFTGRYSPSDVGTLPSALTGHVSVALHLRGPARVDVTSIAATPLYDQALYFLRRDKQSFDEAIPLLEQASQLDSISPLPFAAMAEAQLMKYRSTKDQKWLEAAKRALDGAESRNPDSARVRLISGLLNQTSGRYEKAFEDYHRAQQLEPLSSEAFRRLGSLYNSLDMPDKAIEAYRRAIQLEPDYYVPHHELGAVYYYHGRYAEAVDQFRKVVELAPELPQAYMNLGAALNDLGQDEEAEQALLTSLKLKETYETLNSFGAIRAYQKRDAEAAAYYEQAIALGASLGKSHYVPLSNLGDSYRRLGRLQDAHNVYQQALELALGELKENPRLGFARGFVAYLATRLGDARRAQDEIQQALHFSPNDNKVIRRAVLTYEALGDRKKALEALRGSTPDLLRELARQPDLADFCTDSRFKELLAQSSRR